MILKENYTLLILLSTTCWVQFIIFYENKYFNKVEEECNNISDKIDNYIHFENKNKRSIYKKYKIKKILDW